MMRKKYIGITAGVLAFVLLFVALSIETKVYNLSPVSALEYDEGDVFSAAYNRTVAADSFVLTSGGSRVDASEVGYDGSQSVVLLEHLDSFRLTVDIGMEASYNIAIDYRLLASPFDNAALQISIDGATPDDRLAAVPLPSRWTAISNDFAMDRFGNQIIPEQVMREEFATTMAEDFEFLRELPLRVPLAAGVHTVDIRLRNGDAYIGSIAFVSPEQIISYEDYRAAHADKAGASGQTATIEAEKPYYKNDTSIIPQTSRELTVTPYATNEFLLNTIGDSWEKPGQAVSYEIDAPSSGLYKLAFFYCSSAANATAYRKITIDGSVPFLEMLHYPLPYAERFTLNVLGAQDDPYYFYLEQGKHTLTLSVDASIYAQVLSDLNDVIESIDNFYIDLKKLVGGTSDANRDWDIRQYFPTIVEDFNGYVAQVEQIIAQINAVNQDTKSTQEIAFLQTAARSLRALAEKPDTIPQNIAKIRESSGSIMQMLYNSIYIHYQPLMLDKIFVVPSGEEITVRKPSVFKSFWEGVKRFLASFGSRYRQTSDDNTIEVWINRSRTQMNQLQKMTDADFTAKTGIKVNYSIMPDEGKLILANASNTAPHVALSVSNQLPYELGIRSATVDLRQFDDYADVIKDFVPGNMVNMIANERALGLPETQDFYVLFYRSDITDAYGFEVPDTWDDVIHMLPELQRNGMNFYLPLSGATGTKPIATTMPFIYQFGGSLYSEDGSRVAIDSNQSISAMRLLTDLYTLYGLPLTTASFFESFRNGTVPIGISTFDTFLKLSIAAPELKGKWKLAPVPGVRGSDNVVNRTTAGGGTSNIIFRDDKMEQKSWQFLKWYMSEAVQTEYMQKMQVIYGKEYLWNSANINSFFAMPLEEEHRVVIEEQMEWILDVAKVPGWYMIERELSNVWTNVVLNGENLRSSIDNAAIICNKEITRKLTELGYIRNGEVVREFKITTLDDVRAIINGTA